MKIVNVKARGLRGGTPPGGWSDELKPDDVIHTIIVVHTEEGVYGVGSAFTSEALVLGSLASLAPLYLGENALEPERVSEKLHQGSFWIGRGGAVTHTISGIDLALWDILGKVSGQPVGRLLGGCYRNRVKPYASILMDAPGPMAEYLIELKERGFRAFKIGWGAFGRVDRRTDEHLVKAAREAIGDDSLLMVDPGGSDSHWRGDYKWALGTAEMLARYGVSWLEEPLSPDLLQDYVALRRSSPVPIAGGEVFTRRQSFTPFLQAGAFDVVQPDVTKVGGLSEQRRIGWMAQEFGIRLIPHGWNTAVGLAADLQLASALANTDLVEYKVDSPYIDDLAAQKWELDDEGTLAIPSSPGLGVEFDPLALERYTGDPNLLAGNGQ